MARTKKTAVKSETPSTAPKTRGIDLQEVEARVTALDKAKRRSYDIFDIEERVYNLEKNGTGGGGAPKFDVIQGPVTSTSDISGTVTAKDYYPGFAPENAFLSNSGWIAYSADTYWQYTMAEAHKVNMITWDVTDSNRNQVPTGFQISTDGETFTDADVVYVSNKVIIPLTENPVFAFRILFKGSYSTSTYPIMGNMTVKGE